MVDESTGKGVAEFLKEQDYDTVFIGTDNKDIEDKEITSKAFEEDRVTIKHDKDFGKLAVKEKRDNKGILLLRLKIETPSNKINTVKNILNQHSDKLENKLVKAKENQIKTRKIS
jgi:predicted nuclease of predicted toxin-antitoxin system